MINTNDDMILQFAVIGFRRLLSFEESPPIQAVVDANLVPKFIGFLGRDDLPKLQFESAWCLTNIASGEHEHVEVLIGKGTVDAFVRLLRTQHFEVIEQAIWGLGNLAGDNPRIRDIVINAGAVNPIAELLDRTAPGNSFVRNASWTLSNFCRGRPAPKFEKVIRCIPSLAKVLIENDAEEILTDICWAMSYISDGGQGHIPVILQTNVLPRLVQLLEHDHLAISVASLRTIGNILTGNDEETQAAIDAGALEAFVRLITHPKKAIRKEVCWSVSNITAGNKYQIQMALDSGLIDKLVHLLQHDDTDIKKEAVWALSNCTTYATPQQYYTLADKGALQALVAVLDIQTEARTLIVSMEGISNILKCGKQHFTNEGQDENPFAVVLEKCGGVDKIEDL